MPLSMNEPCQCIFHLLPLRWLMTRCLSADSGPAAAPLGLQGAMVSYSVTDALEEDAGSRLRRGDEVRFKVGGVNANTQTWIEFFEDFSRKPSVHSYTGEFHLPPLLTHLTFIATSRFEYNVQQQILEHNIANQRGSWKAKRAK